MPGVGFLIFRSAFALAEQIAPSLTGRAAFALFRRTRNPARVSTREAQVLRDAAPFMAQARRKPLTSRAGCVVAYDFPGTAGSGAPTVLVLHGWNARTEHMRPVISTLNRAGYRVVALDFPGHGRSAGRSLDLALAVAAVRSAADWFGPFTGIVGHSFGGAVAINAMAGSIRSIAPVEADRLVLIASPGSMPAIFSDFGRFLGLGPRTQVALAGKVAHVTGRPLEDFVGAQQLSAMRVETLVIHAPDDKEVAFDSARSLEAAGDHVTLLRAPGLGHRRILGDTRALEAVENFLLFGEAGAA